MIPEASADRVLTMTYLDGLDWAAAQQADQDLKNTWAEVLTRFITGSYRHGNLFHADPPTPGNYRFGLDGTVGFLDFGCVKVLTEHTRQMIVTMMHTAVNRRKDELRELMVESGFLTADSTLTAEETFQWYAGIIHEILGPQPATYTEEASARAIEYLIDVRSADHPMRRMSVPPDFVFFSRLNLSMNAIFTALHATYHARAMLDDMDGIAEPVSDLGRSMSPGSKSAASRSDWITMTSADITGARLPWEAADPYEFYEARRAEGSVVWDEAAQAWLILSYDAARQVLGGTGWTSDPFANALAQASSDAVSREFSRRSMLFADGADHRRLRGSVRDVFTRSFIENLGSGVESIADDLIGHPPTGREFDFMADIALPLPIAVVSAWLDLDAEAPICCARSPPSSSACSGPLPTRTRWPRVPPPRRG